VSLTFICFGEAASDHFLLPTTEILHCSQTVGKLRYIICDFIARFPMMPLPDGLMKECDAIVGGLADLLMESSRVDFAFVRLCDPNGGNAVESARGNASPSLRFHLISGFLAFCYGDALHSNPTRVHTVPQILT
jgi:hypothetical protein